MVFVPLRLRSAALLALGFLGAGAIPVVLWMLKHPRRRRRRHGRAARPGRRRAHVRDRASLIVLVLVTAGGFWRRAARWTAVACRAARPAAGSAGRLIACSSLGVLRAVGALGDVFARADRARSRTCWNAADQRPTPYVSDNAAGRVFQFGSSRPALLASGDRRRRTRAVQGRRRCSASASRDCATRPSPSVVSEAHGYLFETFADLGLLGRRDHARAAGRPGWWPRARPLALADPDARSVPAAIAPSATAWSRWRRSSIGVRRPVDARLDLVLLRGDRPGPACAPAGWPGADHCSTVARRCRVPAAEPERDPGWFDRLAARPAAAATVVLLLVGHRADRLDAVAPAATPPSS